MTGSGNPSGDYSLYNLEFRSTVDEAWYSVRVVLENDKLVVKIWNFSEASDESFSAGDFETVETVDEFVQRFRPVSHQLQDSRCWTVTEGVTVCAAFYFGHDDIRFYDAVVEAVHYVGHSFAKEEEECSCTFVLCWQHGPNEVYDSNASVCKSGMLDKETSHFSTGQKSSLPQHGLQVKEGVRQFGSLAWRKGRIIKCHERNLQDIDFGGKSSTGETGSHLFILIDNLEKDLSSSSIMEFIHKQTSISSHAYAFPSLPSESYTRGAIVLDCEKKLKKIYELLNSADHIVMSSRGRPWVITERCGAFRTTLESLMPISQNRSIDDELKVVHRGAKEYSTAKRTRDLFMDFIEHQQRLHKRLALEEKKILQLSAAV